MKVPYNFMFKKYRNETIILASVKKIPQIKGKAARCCASQ